MKYITLEGDYLSALAHLIREGGQLFSARHRGGSNSVCQGSKITTYWEKDSVMRKKVILLAQDFGLNPEHMTYGRIAKHYLTNIIALPYKNTYFGNEFRHLAKHGEHWHYTYLQSGDLGYCFELDVKSAYLTSLLQGKTMLYDKYKGYVDDGGALENLRNSQELLPKAFRLVLLGCMASHSKNFWMRMQKPDGAMVPEFKSISHIAYGAAFNAVHGAILRLYNLMKTAHNYGGEYIVRVHTDSLLIKSDIPQCRLEKIVNLFVSSGFQLVTKAEGRAYFFDLNCGFIGKHIIGSPQILANNMKSDNVRYWASKLDKDLELNWKQYRLPISVNTEYLP